MIYGFSDVIRIPRLGKIRLGVKEISQRTGAEYPKAVDYFVCPPEVQAVHGERPKELEIMFPYEDIETVFPTALKRYGQQAGLLCKGDGRTAQELVDGTDEWRDVPCTYQNCPHYQRQHCQEVGNLQVILPKVKGCLGVYQIDTTSFHSVTNIKNGLELLRQMVGRISMIPLILEVRMQETHPLVNGKRIQSIVPVMNLKIGKTMYEILEMARQNKLVQAVNAAGALQAPKLEIEGEMLPNDTDYLYPKLGNGNGKAARLVKAATGPQDEEFAEMVDHGQVIDIEADEVTGEEDTIDKDLHTAWDILGTPEAKRKAILAKPGLDKKALLASLNAEIDRRNANTPAPPPPPPPQAVPPQAQVGILF